MNGELSPGVSTRVLSPFSMKWTVILSTVAFVASTLMAVIDDGPPRLVVWAGGVQFAVTVLVAVIHAWPSFTRGGDDARLAAVDSALIPNAEGNRVFPCVLAQCPRA